MGSSKQALVVVLCVIAVIAASVSIYFTEFHKPAVNETLHLGVGRAMANETANVLGKPGKVVALVMDFTKVPEMRVQFDEFQRTLEKLGKFTLSKKEFETEGKVKYTTGTGLSGRRFVRALQNHGDADAIVSFVGAPTLNDEEFGKIDSSKLPKFVAEVRTPEKLKKLFNQHVIQVAIVSRFQFPAPGPRKPRTPEDWFQNRFQIVTAENAGALPESTKE